LRSGRPCQRSPRSGAVNIDSISRTAQPSFRYSPLSIGASAEASKRIPVVRSLNYNSGKTGRDAYNGSRIRSRRPADGIEPGGKMHFPAPFGRPLIGAAVVAIVTAGAIAVARAEIRIAVAGPLSVSPMTAQYATFGEELRRGAERSEEHTSELQSL